MKAGFAIWVDAEQFRAATVAIKTASDTVCGRMALEVESGRLLTMTESRSVEIPCECAHKFIATATVKQMMRLFDLRRKSPAKGPKVMIAVRPMDNKVATEWAAAKVKFQEIG